MDRQTYEELSPRMQPTFANTRSRLYDLYQQYLKRKRELGDRDPAERLVPSPRGTESFSYLLSIMYRTHDLLSFIRSKRILGKKVDYL